MHKAFEDSPLLSSESKSIMIHLTAPLKKAEKLYTRENFIKQKGEREVKGRINKKEERARKINERSEFLNWGNDGVFRNTPRSPATALG